VVAVLSQEARKRLLSSSFSGESADSTVIVEPNMFYFY